MMGFILVIKIILVILSILSLGLLPLMALFNRWMWNTIIVEHVLSSAIPIESFWIVLGLTCAGSGLISPIFNMVKNWK